ncbi:MAG: putative ATPase involved in repair [Noviherbaspirillum sp.]|nr:putative ATPase involved in repair [Noviherbaspirillum sp.]
MKQAALKRAAIALLALSAASAAFAQYSWLDERGVKQYSDRPAPPGVPQNRILKAPGKTTGSSTPAARPIAETAHDSTGSPSSPATKLAPMTTAEKNADFQRRRAEQAEKQKKSDEEEKMAIARSVNCERAGEYKRVLESGERIVRNDKNGERIFLTDEQRARELRDTRQVIVDDCR